MKQYTKPRKS